MFGNYSRSGVVSPRYTKPEDYRYTEFGKGFISGISSVGVSS